MQLAFDWPNKVIAKGSYTLTFLFHRVRLTVRIPVYKIQEKLRKSNSVQGGESRRKLIDP